MTENNHRSMRSNTLTEDAKRLFHINYEYMWETLAVSPYQVKYGAETPYSASGKMIEGVEFLPCYSTCYQLFKENAPITKGTINKIIKFYNANLRPIIKAEQFWTENLKESANVRLKGTSRYDGWFIGTYYCYYWSGWENAVSGAILKIFKRDNIVKASLVTGIHSDEDFQSDTLKMLFKTNPLAKKHFDRFHNARISGSRRLYYFEGNVEITSSSLLIVFQNCEEEDTRKLIFTLTKKDFLIAGRIPMMAGLPS